HAEAVAFADRLALLAEDLLDGPLVLGLDRDLHLHRLEDHDGVALLDRVADRDLDFPYVAGDVRLDIRHGAGQYPPWVTPSRSSSPRATRPTGSAGRSRPCAAPFPRPRSGSPTTPRPTTPRVSR